MPKPIHVSKTEKLGKYALLVITIWPILYVVYFLLLFTWITSVWITSARDLQSSFFPSYLTTVHFVTLIVTFVSFVVYVIHLYSNSRIKNGNDKMLWVLGFVFFGQIVMLPYWWKHIR
jgi:hypothetical protein